MDANFHALRKNGTELRKVCQRPIAGALGHVRDAKGRTLVHLAASLGLGDLISSLGPWVAPDEPDFDGATPLHFTRDSEVARLLVDARAALGSNDFGGLTPLHAMIKSSQSSIRSGGVPASVEMLLQRRAVVDALSRRGRTPLHHCPSVDVARVLLQHRADPSATDDTGGTPLHSCSRSRKASPELVTLLLDAGAEASGRDDLGRTAADYAARPQVAKLLRMGRDGLSHKEL